MKGSTKLYIAVAVPITCFVLYAHYAMFLNFHNSDICLGLNIVATFGVTVFIFMTFEELKSWDVLWLSWISPYAVAVIYGIVGLYRLIKWGKQHLDSWADKNLGI